MLPIAVCLPLVIFQFIKKEKGKLSVGVSKESYTVLMPNTVMH
jgi:hypothetical protein